MASEPVKEKVTMTSEGKKPASLHVLTPSDNSGSIITQVQLTRDNYDEWARAMRTSLRAKKNFRFIDGSIEQPDKDSSELEDWWTVNSMLVSWMLNNRANIAIYHNVYGDCTGFVGRYQRAIFYC
ncbi:UNVERIFIED_CONTAM: hypothetical protein Slati_0020400 [Sesamum latifolium]|uniref:Retrotransposon Copia-like N-terminal domain-containing protein n=1 Tax=Sesamum latifolium TaxID=2727402 RepID=A0AAW2Y690_9LAMI